MFKYDDPTAKSISPETRKALAERIEDDVDEFCVKEFTDEHRHHLGASIIGKECWREIWYIFRWAKFEAFDGRMLRLFERGHLEEARFIQYLRGIGCTVWEVDPNTGKQFRIWGVQGHYGGSSDSIGVLPYFPDLPMLLEFKTHNAKSFANLIKKGVQGAKFGHYTQMCAYGKHFGFKYALYCAVNKNDDDLHFEVVELDWRLSHDTANKADELINAKTPPNRISDSPAYFECANFCHFLDICHHGAPVEKNCRSCRMAEPVANGEWHCSRFQQVIPKDFISKGCDQHSPIG